VAARSKAYTGPAPDDQDAQHGQQEAAEPAAGGDAAGCRSGASNAGSTPVFDPEALADYRRCVADPDTVHAMCEDYRAGAGIRRRGRRRRRPVDRLPRPWPRSGRDEPARWFDTRGRLAAVGRPGQRPRDRR
jgi:hypothetical protein